MKGKIALFSILSFSILALPFVSARASEGDCPEFDSGKEFGEHVSMHAKEGHLGKDMNPGMHKGFSEFAPGSIK